MMYSEIITVLFIRDPIEPKFEKQIIGSYCYYMFPRYLRDFQAAIHKKLKLTQIS